MKAFIFTLLLMTSLVAQADGAQLRACDNITTDNSSTAYAFAQHAMTFSQKPNKGNAQALQKFMLESKRALRNEVITIHGKLSGVDGFDENFEGSYNLLKPPTGWLLKKPIAADKLSQLQEDLNQVCYTLITPYP